MLRGFLSLASDSTSENASYPAEKPQDREMIVHRQDRRVPGWPQGMFALDSRQGRLRIESFRTSRERELAVFQRNRGDRAGTTGELDTQFVRKSVVVNVVGLRGVCVASTGFDGGSISFGNMPLFVNVVVLLGIFRTVFASTSLGGGNIGFGNMPQRKRFHFINIVSCGLVRVTGKEGYEWI